MILNPRRRMYVLTDKSTSTYDMREMIPEKKKNRSDIRSPLVPWRGFRRCSISIEPRYTERDARWSSEKAPIFWLGAGGGVHRPSLKLFQTSVKLDGRNVGDAMWRSRWAATLLYTSVRMHGWHYAGARTFRRARDGRSRAVDRVSVTRRGIHAKLVNEIIEREQYLLHSLLNMTIVFPVLRNNF